MTNKIEIWAIVRKANPTKNSPIGTIYQYKKTFKEALEFINYEVYPENWRIAHLQENDISRLLYE